MQRALFAGVQTQRGGRRGVFCAVEVLRKWGYRSLAWVILSKSSHKVHSFVFRQGRLSAGPRSSVTGRAGGGGCCVYVRTGLALQLTDIQCRLHLYNYARRGMKQRHEATHVLCCRLQRYACAAVYNAWC